MPSPELSFFPPKGHPCPALRSPPALHPDTLKGLLSARSSVRPVLCPADRPLLVQGRLSVEGYTERSWVLV